MYKTQSSKIYVLSVKNKNISSKDELNKKPFPKDKWEDLYTINTKVCCYVFNNDCGLFRSSVCGQERD